MKKSEISTWMMITEKEREDVLRRRRWAMDADTNKLYNEMCDNSWSSHPIIYRLAMLFGERQILERGTFSCKVRQFFGKQYLEKHGHIYPE